MNKQVQFNLESVEQVVALATYLCKLEELGFRYTISQYEEEVFVSLTGGV